MRNNPERRRSFTVNKMQSSISNINKNTTNIATSSEQKTYKFYLGNGNNAHLIRRILSTRKNWVQISDPGYMFINFKWQQTQKGFHYDSCVQNKIFKLSLNHLEYHHELSNKENLFKNIMDFCESNKINAFEYVPITFVLNVSDPNFDSSQNAFLKFYESNLPEKLKQKDRKQWLNLPRRRVSSSSITDKRLSYYYSKPEIKQCFMAQDSSYLWILKPTFYNRGRGIHVFSDISTLQQLMCSYVAESSPLSESYSHSLAKSTLVQTSSQTQQIKSAKEPKKRAFRVREITNNNNSNKVVTKSFIIQKYLESPLLIDSRKFDIRVWVLVTHEFRVYFFKEGYIRTSSSMYSLRKQQLDDLSVHLTNNAVQKNLNNYGKYEQGNQLSFKYLQNYIYKHGGDFSKILWKMKKIVKMTMLSARKRLNKNNRKNCFEMFGYDFMIDSQFKTWLIEINTNPCLEESSLILENLLPRMVDDMFKLTLDQIFQGSQEGNKTNYVLQDYENNDNLWDFVVDLKRPGNSF